mmetsp:Transcript_24694/g.46959  ORF Transcript_24694/g.46959 Transcript_24694/m.46959 type:complete len:503 (+) Transcript_24694:95-1603(+)
MGGQSKEEKQAASVKAKSLSRPNLLQALVLLIFVVAVSNIGAVYFLDGTTKEKYSWEYLYRSPDRLVDFVDAQVPTGNEAQHQQQRELQDDPRAPTLALAYPPGLMGGYRNQVIRFMGLCLYAKRKNITQLFEPSLLWSTSLEGVGSNVQWLPIPMHWLFDIDHWNQVAAKESLPRIVKTLDDLDCWQTSLFDQFNTTNWGLLPRASLLESGSLAGVVNETYRMISNDPTFKVRRTDILPILQHCKRPIVYGGGKMAGHLWNDMMKLRERGVATPGNLDRHVLRALQPAPQWQEVANSCLSLATASDETYVALHARVELEMLVHPCGKTMEQNLTNIFGQVRDLVDSRQKQSPQNIVGLFVAMSRSGIGYTDQYSVKLKEVAEHNVKVLDHYIGDPDTKLGEYMKVFECGERLLETFYSEHPDVPDHGSLLQAVVNFHLAVNAAIFIGVRGSSYSTDVWTTRYYLGRGADNYRYTQEGKVEAIENRGLPDPHTNCGNKRKQK